MRRIFSITYHLIGWLLPDSYFYLRIFNKKIRIKIGYYVRGFLAKKILKEAGENINIERGAKFDSTVSLGNNSGIGKNSSVAPYTKIGNDVMIAPEVVMYSRNHRIDRTDIPMNQQGFTEIEPITIEDDVWIGRRVIILPGVKIGKGSVIGAGAVVAKDIPPYSVVIGNPARIIKNRKGKVHE